MFQSNRNIEKVCFSESGSISELVERMEACLLIDIRGGTPECPISRPTSSIRSIKEVILNIEESVRPFWKTALRIREMVSAIEERMESLKRQEMEQEILRKKLGGLVNKPVIPREVISTILSFIPSSNLIEGSQLFFVEGLLFHVTLDPILFTHYYGKRIISEEPMEKIAEKVVKPSLLKSLPGKIVLRVQGEIILDSLFKNIIKHAIWTDVLKPSNMRLTVIDGHSKELDMGDFKWFFERYLTHLERLAIRCTDAPEMPESFSLSLECNTLKVAQLSANIFTIFFNSGFLRSVTELNLTNMTIYDSDATKGEIRKLPRMISQLLCLQKLGLEIPECDWYDLTGVSRATSVSLRSLKVDAFGDHIIPFILLFADCPIESIFVHASLLMKVESHFPNIRDIHVMGFIPEELCERKQDGTFAFPNADCVNLYKDPYSDDHVVSEVQSRLLRILGVRARNPAVRPIKHARLPRAIVTNAQFQEELEAYLPSLVLS